MPNLVVNRTLLGAIVLWFMVIPTVVGTAFSDIVLVLTDPRIRTGGR